MFKLRKKYKIILILLASLIISYELIVRVGYDSSQSVRLGVAFSKPYAEFLGLDWKESFNNMTDDLGVKLVKIPFYWNDIERKRGEYNFTDYDWLMAQSKEKGLEVLPVVGKRLPRWPECHEPDWYKKLNQQEKEAALLEWLNVVVSRYKDYNNIKMWQVENEPFLTVFGECEKASREIINKEVAQVKALDGRPILITDSGELSSWYKSSRSGDYLGTTVYRIVHNPVLGYFSYWFVPPSFYRLKARLNFKSWDKMLVSELQTESWFPNDQSALNTPLDEQAKSMSPMIFRQNLQYAKEIGFDDVYLWGVEWWDWLKIKAGDDSLWQEAKKAF